MPERSAERDKALIAMLPLVERGGWTIATLAEAAGRDADLLFPGGVLDLIEAYCDLGDRWMIDDARSLGLDRLRVPERVRAIIAARLSRNTPMKAAVRRAVGALAVPGRGRIAARCTARTVDAIWFAAGDSSADFSWYSKRVILTGVYGATLLFWLSDAGDGTATLDFLDRRLDGIARIGRLTRQVAGGMPRPA